MKNLQSGDASSADFDGGTKSDDFNKKMCIDNNFSMFIKECNELGQITGAYFD